MLPSSVCGASSLIGLKRCCIDRNAIDTILVTHFHADHFGGVPFFILDAQFYSRRTAPLTLVGPPGFRVRLAEAMEVFFPGSPTASRKFTTELREIAAGDDFVEAIRRSVESSTVVLVVVGLVVFEALNGGG